MNVESVRAISKILAVPVIVIGALNAAAKPLIPGFCLISRYCVTTCCFTDASQFSGVMSVGAPNSGPRSSNGSSMDGSVLKNSTPAPKSVM